MERQIIFGRYVDREKTGAKCKTTLASTPIAKSCKSVMRFCRHGKRAKALWQQPHRQMQLLPAVRSCCLLLQSQFVSFSSSLSSQSSTTETDNREKSNRVSLSFINDGIAKVELSRPSKLNSLDMPMFEAIADTAAKLREDRSVRAVILCGAGRAFSTGLDVVRFMKNTNGDCAYGIQIAHIDLSCSTHYFCVPLEEINAYRRLAQQNHITSSRSAFRIREDHHVGIGIN